MQSILGVSELNEEAIGSSEAPPFTPGPTSFPDSWRCRGGQEEAANPVPAGTLLGDRAGQTVHSSFIPDCSVRRVRGLEMWQGRCLRESDPEQTTVQRELSLRP